MSKQLGTSTQKLSGKIWLGIIIIAFVVCLLIFRSIGVMQPLEWAAVDSFFRILPQEPTDERVVIVTIDEADLWQVGKWPLPDRVMAQLLQKLHAYQPCAIGLDIYRDLPVPPGSKELNETFESIPNLIGIEQLKDQSSSGILPASTLSRLNRVGFNNVVLDADGKVRRGMLYWTTPQKVHESFDLKLALMYLQAEGITPRSASNNSEYLQLGKSVFRRFEPNDGGYVKADAGGYQILSNFRRPATSFRQVSITDVLTDSVPAQEIRDRIVLIGSTAASLRDVFYTPNNTTLLFGAAQPLSGVELHANFISQIISAAVCDRPLIHVWSDFWESLWISSWAFVGSIISLRSRLPCQSFLSILLVGTALIGGSYLAFVYGWWLPIVPSLLALFGSAGAIALYIAQQQEKFKRSKDFLQGVINTIPDPIFVKNKEHCWIVLNQAYCQLIGYPHEILIEKSDYEFFPKQEAEIFRQQDELVFASGIAMEHEEKFTDATGETHLIATKRSLHKDAAGNLFLVGVIRDITERKRVEDELKRTTAELLQTNTELQLSEQRLRYLAHHDPLTSLPNRYLFYQHLDQSLAWAQNHQVLVGLLFIDLDGFKQINDTLGHDWGDHLLIAVATRLSGCLRHSDIVSRLGGDEFTVILPGIPDVSIAVRVANKILTTLGEAFVLEGKSLLITASVGISVYPIHSDSRETLVKQADTAMYKAKQSGKNRYHLA